MAGSTAGALPHDAAVALYLALTLILLVARILGEIAKKLNQPAVMGELLAGVLLGKTCLYYISPSFFNLLFSPANKQASALAGVTSICVTLYMLVAGLEMNMKNAMKKKRASLSVGFFALAVPFALGYIFCYFFPQSFGLPPGKSINNFSLFTATAMAITALPVVAKTLRDLHLFKTDLGVVVMSAAVFDDILGWSLFAITLAVSAGESSSNGLSLAGSISISIIYVILILTAGSYVVDKALPFIQAYFSYPPGELGFVCLFALASSTFALWVGLHNTLGAFVVGAAIGNSRHFRHEMRETLDTFVSFMLAPIFFGSVCINANFVSDFDAVVVFSIFFLSCAGKLIGGFIGAKIAGSSARESLAVAVCMNSRGAMELVLAQVALDVGIIDGKVFVALVFMAIVTSIIPGPLLRRILKRPTTTSVLNIVPKYGFHPKPSATSMHEAVRELATSLKHPELANMAIEREMLKEAPVWENLAIPTAISKSIKKPLAALSVFPGEGIVWIPGFSAEHQRVRYAVLLIIPESDHTIEFDLMREVAHLFAASKFCHELDEVKNVVELYALFQIEKYRQGMSGHDTNQTPISTLKETGMLAVDVNEIIQQSPRAQPAAPDLVFSPRTVEMLQSGNDHQLPAANDPLDPESIIEIKARPQRRETKTILQTIEDYVGPIPPENSIHESGEAPQRRKSTTIGPESATGSMSKSDKSSGNPVAFAPPPALPEAGVIPVASIYGQQQTDQGMGPATTSFVQLNSPSSTDSSNPRRSTLEENGDGTSDTTDESGDNNKPSGGAGNNQLSMV